MAEKAKSDNPSAKRGFSKGKKEQEKNKAPATTKGRGRERQVSRDKK